ncbi:hypothetical protein O181_028681 [Austropuccinia psidii MF-1]|uniref:AAA+ ATPase domain-containing protein n=1 Tax=Austropuccinia psidii MF-1 TaxID=1389203 RepID=A0A9Q3H2L7_9BASI|nr:hypothetical protein [Austropuccinia psidii MF-1]
MQPSIQPSEPSMMIKGSYNVIEEVWSDLHYGWNPKPTTDILSDGCGSNDYLFTIHIRQGPRDKLCDTMVTFYSIYLIEPLQTFLSDCPEVFQRHPQLVANQVFFIIESMRELYQNFNSQDYKTEDDLKQLLAFETLLGWFDETYFDIKQEFGRLVEKNQISFKLLWLLFRVGDKVATIHPSSDQPLGALIESVEYTFDNGKMNFYLRTKYFIYDGLNWQLKDLNRMIPTFSGVRNIKSLQIFPLSADLEDILIQRGSLALEYSGIRYLNYGGPLVITLGGGCNLRIVKERAEGRCMIDVQNFRRMVPYNNEFGFSLCDPDEGKVNDSTEIQPEDIWRLSPTLHGFSFVTKRWGELLVERLSSIDFDHHAFDHLILPSRKKELIRGLVESSQGQASYVKDVISQKGGGLVFCLYGAAGCGKTLTAEAVAEVLKRPLYNIGSGELGTNAALVETNLRDALDIAAVWNAVVLIDEADVYMQERGLHDLERNALVSVFLKLLDYHKGILFLTTNRLETVDPAFASRFSIALKFPPMDIATREEIWSNFFRRSGIMMVSSYDVKQVKEKDAASGIITLPELEYLSKIPFNGRMIRNLVRTAQGLAWSRQERLAFKHFEEVIDVSTMFITEFKLASTDTISS